MVPPRDIPVFRRSNGKWYCNFYNQYGRRKIRSLKIPDSSTQREAIDRFYAIKDSLYDDPYKISIARAEKIILNQMSSQRSEGTIAKYHQAFIHLIAYCEKRCIDHLTDLASYHINDLLSIIAATHKPAGVNSIRSSLKTVMNLLDSWGYMPEGYDSSRWFKASKQKVSRRERVFSMVELETIFRDELYGDVFKLLYLTGARIGELLSVHSSNVGNDGSITFPFTKGIDDYRTAPLSGDALEFIQCNCRDDVEDGFIIWRARWGSPWDKRDRDNARRRIYNQLQKILIANKLQPGRVHDIRATTASHLSDKIPMLVLMQIMGWKTPATAQSYYRTKASQVSFPILPGANICTQPSLVKKIVNR